MKIECTVSELKLLLKNEQAEEKSDCSIEKITDLILDSIHNAVTANCDSFLKNQ